MMNGMNLPLTVAVEYMFAGIAACSRDIYEKRLQRVAKLAGRIVDCDLRRDVARLLQAMPSPLEE